MEFHGLTYRDPRFDAPGDRRVLARIIAELQRMISPKLDLHKAIEAYREYRCRDAHERRTLDDLRHLIGHRLARDHQISYSGWLWARHKLNAMRDREAFVRAQNNWLESIAQEFRP